MPYKKALADLQAAAIDPALTDRQRILAQIAEDAVAAFIQELISGEARKKSDPLGNKAVKPAPSDE